MLTKIAQFLVDQTLTAISAGELIQKSLTYSKGILNVAGTSFPLDRFERVIVLGAGKASAAMALALEKILGERIDKGFIITKYGHALDVKHVVIKEAAHPVSDEQTICHSLKMMQLALETTAADFVLFLLSGGASALFEVPVEDVTLAQLQIFNSLLLQSGAPISVLNSLRYRLSRVKGGKMARLIAPAKCVTLAISDVPGDVPALIGSGPTVSEPTSEISVRNLLKAHGLDKALPDEIVRRLEMPVSTQDKCTNTDYYILGNNHTAITAIEQAARNRGFDTRVLDHNLDGEAGDATLRLVAQIKKSVNAAPVQKPLCLIWGGETTVSFKKAGKGGRNQEMALTALLALKDFKMEYRAVFLGTDGTDGPTDAAGAIISPALWPVIKSKNIDPKSYLEKHDSYKFFDQVGGLLKTGPTGTNVMDVGFILIDKPG